MTTIYTIGYSGFTIENFLKTLKQYKITALIDVRSLPRSAYFKDFDKENISRLLKRNEIIYRHYHKEFGARQTDIQFFTDGILDFEKFSASPQFLDGVKKIEAGMDLGYTFVFMCAEKYPETCHRCILVAKKFYDLGYDVKHILSDGNLINQKEVEKILLDKYFPKRNQISLFDELSPSEMIRQSYIKRNLEIGYKIEEGFNEETFHNGVYEKDG